MFGVILDGVNLPASACHMNTKFDLGESKGPGKELGVCLGFGFEGSLLSFAFNFDIFDED